MKTKVFLSFLSLIVFVQCTRPVNRFWEIMSDPPQVFMDAIRDDTPADARVVASGLFDHSQPYYEIYSAGNDQFAGTDDGDLYIRNRDSDDYAKRIKPNNGWYWHIDNAMWSPDGRYLIAKQINDEGVPRIKLTHESPEDISYKTYFRAGEKIPVHQFYIIDTETWESVAVRQNSGYPYVHIMDWHPDNSHLFLVESDRLMKEIRLQKIGVSDGESTLILKENSDTYLIGLNLLQGNSRRLIDQGLFTLLPDRDQFIWLSESSGIYQMYLYDYEGTLIRPLTSGIFEFIIDIDHEDNWFYYTAYTDTTEPYKLQVYRSSLDVPDIQQLVDTTGVLDVFMAESKDSLFVLRSGLPAMTQMEAYSIAGNHIGTTWKGNVSSAVREFKHAEYPEVLAADQKTVLATLILKPKDFKPDLKYPVVEYIYGGNFTNEVIRDLLSPNLWQMQELANDGFIVAFIDGRGTPKRGQDFRNFSYGKIGQVEIQDHVAALQQLGENRPYMDMNRVGIIGHSWGGHFALRALLEAPDFYKAGHINAAGFDPVNFRVAVEAFMGCLPQDCPESYQKSAISNKLSNLQAPLMITHGTADDDVPIEESYKLMAKLDELNYTNYEFIEYQGVNHIVMREPEWGKTMIGFFEKELK